MKKLLVITVILSLLLTLYVFASNDVVYVTIANGSLLAERKAVALTDADGDGALTINDALMLAHDNKDDYGYAKTEYGLSLTKLWGVSADGFGYYLNNGMTYSLSDTVKNGDEIYAFAYTDSVGFSDTFCFFDSSYTQAVCGEDIKMTLMQGAFDESWNYTPAPVANAEIIVNGEKSGIITDENGNFTVKFDTDGVYKLSAVKEGANLTPPYAEIEVTQVSDTGDGAVFVIISVITASLFACLSSLLAIRSAKRRKENA